MTSSPKKKAKAIVWNAADYAANSAVQQSWARELIAKLRLHGSEHILDVGCGDGKVSAELARAVPRGSVTGVDASPQMIAFARKTFPTAEISNLNFQIMDARKIQPSQFDVRGKGLTPSPRPSGERAGVRGFEFEAKGLLAPALSSPGEGEGEISQKFDLIFSNAALHWVDDHPAFLRGAAACLRSGGRLVVSCGGKGNAQDVFMALRGEMRLKRWRAFFRKLEAAYFFHRPEEYEKWLPRYGFKTQSVQLAPKDVAYPDRAGLATWLRTTWLPYTHRVPDRLREEFIAAVVNRYIARHPLDAAGLVHVRMVRLEIDALKI